MRGTRIVTPQSLRSEIVQLAHEGHQSIVKMKNRLRSKVWWPKMDDDAESVYKKFHGCQVVGEFCAPEPMQSRTSIWTMARHCHRSTWTTSFQIKPTCGSRLLQSLL